MKRISLAIFFVAILAAFSLAQIPSGTAAQPQTSSPQTQQIPAPSAQPPANAMQPTSSATTGAPRIAPGSVIPVKLTKTVDAKKAKTGDEVVANVTQDMKSGSGDLILPKDTKIVGHVTEAQARNKEQKESQMGIAFDKAVTKDGQVNLPMSIQAVIVFQNPNPAAGGDQDSAGSSGPSSASASPSSSARSPMSGATQPPQQPSVPSSATDTQAQSTKNGMPTINGSTQGVIGIQNLTLSTGPNGAQGSVMTSEKNNVRLESGTVLLLKVNQ